MFYTELDIRESNKLIQELSTYVIKYGKIYAIIIYMYNEYHSALLTPANIRVL